MNRPSPLTIFATAALAHGNDIMLKDSMLKDEKGMTATITQSNGGIHVIETFLMPY
jgi:uncharacterized surface protein with fasciclin (FAS1) repeats